jgi:hypothetical protein
MKKILFSLILLSSFVFGVVKDEGKVFKENEIKADLDALYIGYHVIKGLRKEVFADDVDLEFLVDIKIKKRNKKISEAILKASDIFYFVNL